MGIKYCRKCGNQLKDNAKFCGKCGVDIPQELKEKNTNTARLIIPANNGEEHIFYLSGDTTTIGRANADITVDDPGISQRHGLIERRGDKYYIKDLGSSNGIFINDNKTIESSLGNKDKIKLGHTVFEFHGDSISSEIQCIKCGRYNRESSVFCRFCGNKFNEPPIEETKELDKAITETELGLEIIYNFVVISGKDKDKTFPVFDNATIGRKNADIKINDSMVSSKHAVIYIKDNRVIITDTDSKNGIYINDTKAKEMVLKHEDKIRIGNTLLQFIDNNAEDMTIEYDPKIHIIDT